MDMCDKPSMQAFVCVRVYAYTYMCVYIYTYVCMYVCMYVNVYEEESPFLHASMHFVCVCVCLCLCVLALRCWLQTGINEH